ncbi:MAG TPA: glycosyltransferase family 4 protein [Thermodesulfovibrionales bacterium]|jgi:glycosyltransferase involved in cell wall biosynthesis|nr:glycosyltransferase family 4 protein [Thermodesulfovibrionales bacterium]
MNVLLLNINLGTARCCGGIETHSDILISALLSKGYNVIVGCWVDGTLVTNTAGRTVPARRITIRNSGDIGAIKKLVEISRKENIEVIIANSGREYWPAAIAARIAHVRVVLIRHMSTRLKITTTWMINRMVDRIIAVSSSVRDVLTGCGVSPEKVEVIHNSVLLRKLDPQTVDRRGAREELSIDEADMVIGAVGALHKGKGVYELLNAVKKLSQDRHNLKLLFVGDGPERNRLEEEARHLSLLDRVIFTGIRRDIERMYAAMDIFALPSSCDEAFGMVIIEAMAMGRPVIGTKVGGIPDIITDGSNGLLVPPGNEDALAAALSRYLDDGRFRDQMAYGGRRIVEERFSDRIMAERFDRLLKEVAK